MTYDWIVAGAAAVLLAGYLVFTVMKPERF
jgi:K+-transporting ATPase KdpF subunit